MNIFRKVMARILPEAYVTVPTLSNSSSAGFDERDTDTWMYSVEDLSCNEFLGITLTPTGVWGAKEGGSLEIWIMMQGYKCNDLVLNLEFSGSKYNGYTWTALKAVLSNPDDEVAGENLLGMQSSYPNHWLIPRVHDDSSIRGVSPAMIWVDHF